MAATVERDWATRNPEGMFHEDPGPMYLLYNFDIGGDQPKPKHQEFIESTDFSVFLTQQLHRARCIEVIGVASESGRQRTNLTLSARRSVEVRQRIINQIESLQRQGQFDRFDNVFLNRMVTASALGANSVILRRASDQMIIPVNEEGEGYALSRAVLIRANPAGRLTPAQVEIIGREYIRMKYRSLRLPRDFRFNDLWTPSTTALRMLVPDLYVRFNTSPRRSRGMGVPDGRPWGQYTPSYRAMEALFGSRDMHTRMGNKFQNMMFTPSDVHRAIVEVMKEAEAAKNVLHGLERELYQWAMRSGATGGGSLGRESLRHYQHFRDAVFLREEICLLKFNGFRPIHFSGVTDTQGRSSLR
ncbi:hypothetical protein G3O08_08695 [Cryomorpha ignava]|uniref:Uncharacterized protein n=1 Tax=Cryomorpha ignava TaxID=101383 RepID=A0A7K3WPK9_9FLAO|nr:hypothetical protein [Cryomorpha ignava]NEN23577.1 hypothetical protein [Cryomorpha ignava]